MSKTLYTGELYTLSQLFNGEHTKIVIPDLQRDYCWGGKGDLVTGFVRNLIDNGFNKNRAKLTLGLLYGYEESKGHIQLCDGQQRITTLFLLVGLLNRKCNNEYQRLLISDFELNDDDKEPYLQYAIRESSLYFISDLVCNFFLKQSGTISTIPQAPWYFNDYNNDPSIVSMLWALEEIESVLVDYHNTCLHSELVKYITEEISFMYYDMGSRSSGEETFVIINTTGEPLSPTENLKPRYVTKYSNSAQKWEEWEQWFWINRNRKINDTADSGLLEFFRWIILLETGSVAAFKGLQTHLVKQAEDKRFDFELLLKIEPEVIDRYFNVVQKIFANVLPNNSSWLSPNEINSQVDWFRILPLIAYCNKYPQALHRELIRVKQFFKNLSQISNITKDISNLLSEAVEIVWDMQDADIAKITSSSDRLLTSEEKLKFSIFLNSENREEVEDAFWAIQYTVDKNRDGKIWAGEILPILKWSFIDGEFNFEEFKKYNDVFFQVFDGECKGNIDLTRRALITCELQDYPKYFRGQTNKSFGSEFNDWKVLINENKDKFHNFFKGILSSSLPVKETMENMCKDFSKDKKWSEFVHIAELLAFCNEKNIQWWGDAHGWVLVEKQYTRGKHANVNAYKFYLELRKSVENFWSDKGWELWFYEYENTCTVFDNKVNKIAIDIQCVDKMGLFNMEVFVRSEKANTEAELKNYAIVNGLTFNGHRYISESLKKEEVVAKLKSML